MRSSVPCPCDLLGADGMLECGLVSTAFSDVPKIGQLYSALHSFKDRLPIILEGVSSIVETEGKKLGTGIIAAIVLPWMLMFVLIIMVLFFSHVITIEVMGILVIMVLAFSLLGAICMFDIVRRTSNNMTSKSLDTIKNNWTNKKKDIVLDIATSYINCNYSDSDNPICADTCKETILGKNKGKETKDYLSNPYPTKGLSIDIYSP